MTKERERAYFEWQKSFNSYMILLTLIIFLASMIDKTKGWIQSLNFWILSFCISLFGLATIANNYDQLIYELKHLRDQRMTVSRLRKYATLITYSFISLVGLLIMLFGAYLILVISGFFPNPLG